MGSRGNEVRMIRHEDNDRDMTAVVYKRLR